MKNTLQQVNKLIREECFRDAILVLDSLKLEYPALSRLYDQKLNEVMAKQSKASKRLGQVHGHDVGNVGQAPIELKRVIFLTASCHPNEVKRRAIESTWGATLRQGGVRQFFVIGCPELVSAYRLGALLFVPCRDDYESLLLKLALAYEYIIEHEDGFTHVFKIDDDCYLNLARFERDLSNANSDSDYIAGAIQPSGERINRRWHFGKCSDSRFDREYPFDRPPAPYAKGGYGYLLSRRAMGVVTRKISEFRAELDEYRYSYEDLRIGQLMAEASIQVRPLPTYKISPPGSASVLDSSMVFDITNVSDFHRYHREVAVAMYKAGDVTSFLQMAFASPKAEQRRLGVDHVYVVNLRSAIERRVATQWALRCYGVEHELFSAFDGHAPVGDELFKTVCDRQPGELQGHPQYAELERWRGSKFIASRGAVGYILSYVRLLRDAQARGFQRILILEDDVLLRHDFLAHLAQFMGRVGDDWKLLQLGASQYSWESVDLEEAAKEGYYRPKALDTCGSFAIAIDLRIADELIAGLLSFDGPFDHIPLGQIYEKEREFCYVAYPNIVIPDVSESFIREGRDQKNHSAVMRWPLEHFDYPRRRIRLGLVFRFGAELQSFPPDIYGVDLLCYRVSADGLRPAHGLQTSAEGGDVLTAEQEERWLDQPHALPVDLLFAVSRKCHGIEVVLEALDSFRRFGADVGDRRSRKWLFPLQNLARRDRKGQAAVVIPTRGRREALVHAVASVLDQDWPDKEVIVVDENDPGSDFADFVRAHVQSLQKGGAPIRLIPHSHPRNAAAARNTGLLSTRAEFISFLDDDDAYLPGRLRNVIEVLARRGPEVGGAYCGFLGWNSKVNDPARYPTDHLARRLLNLEFRTHYVCTDTVTYRREALLAVNGYDETFRRHQDLELNVRVFSQYAIEVYPEALVQLNPLPPDNANKLYGVDLLSVKMRFLSKFDDAISKLGLEHEEIYAAHVKELLAFTKDLDAAVRFALLNPSRFTSAYLSKVMVMGSPA